MFRVGDRVVYPMHGAGIIEAIEEREVLGRKQTYYVMRIPLGDMKVFIPTEATEELGLRGVVSEQGLHEAFAVLREHSDSELPAWNRRYRANMEKIKSGSLSEVAEVVRTLALREREKGLSTGERKMLDCARQILLSEIALAKGVAVQQAMALVDAALAL